MTPTKKILIAEDEEDILWAVTKSLTRWNADIEVRWATDGNQAYEMLRHERYDLVISDVYMPGRNGIELSMDVKRLSPQTKIILMTSCSSAEMMRKAAELTEYVYVQKPFDLGYLTGLVFETLGMPMSHQVFNGNYLSRG